jgi:hypothetical protein
VWLGKGRWHRLDNVGAILCFVVLLIQWVFNVFLLIFFPTVEVIAMFFSAVEVFF